jgi:methylmalonyl-CoA mutase N-terminal domain/subunit
MLEAAKSGWMEEQILEARVARQRAIESGEQVLVGVNRFTVSEEEEPEITLSRIKAEEWENSRKDYLRRWREQRDPQKTEKALKKIQGTMKTDENMIPVISEALKAGATHGEIHKAMRDAFRDFVTG